ncbi:MAG: hypothetical protein LQ338_001540 [Usnochroma carphineum]|nr:MAG: hypothetical protein LQ338_001540 [Usnochroma carphineum]
MPPTTAADQAPEPTNSVELRQTSTSQFDGEIVYSTFSKTSKRWISFAASSAAMFSGLSSFIYYPAIGSLAKSLNTSVELINLTITSYLIVSGLVPSIVGDLADRAGRRPLYLATFTKGTITLAYGVIADIAPPSERGSYVGMLMGL